MGTGAERAFVNGYATANNRLGNVATEGRGPRLPEYTRRVDELMGDNDAFNAVIETHEGDREIKGPEMRLITSAALGYDVLKGRYPNA